MCLKLIYRDDMKCTLFKSFCSNMYCSTIWYNGTVTAMRKLRIAYNNSFRRLLGIPNYIVQVRCPCILISSHSVNYRGNMYTAL